MGASTEIGGSGATRPDRVQCPDCSGTGELRIDSDNINEHFEVERQTVITPCPACEGTGSLAAR